MVQASSMDNVTKALSMAISAESAFQISAINVAQKMQDSSLEINQSMARTANESFLNEEKLGTLETVVSTLMLVTMISMGLGAAADGASLFAEEGTASRVVKFAQPTLKVLGGLSSFGTAGASMAEAAYQAKQGAIEGNITRAQACISLVHMQTGRLTRSMSNTVQSEEALATVSTEVISNNLSANTAR